MTVKIGKKGLNVLVNNNVAKKVGQIIPADKIQEIIGKAGGAVGDFSKQIEDAILGELIKVKNAAVEAGQQIPQEIDDALGKLLGDRPLAIEGGPNPGRGQTGKTPGGNNNTGGGQTSKQPESRGKQPKDNEPSTDTETSGSINFPTSESVLEGLSNRNKKHLKKHLDEFQQLDPKITEESLRELGANIVKPENLTSSLDAEQLHFDKVIDINGTPTKVRAVLNRERKLRSIQIRYK